jgi:hypothetical protein
VGGGEVDEPFEPGFVGVVVCGGGHRPLPLAGEVVAGLLPGEVAGVGVLGLGVPMGEQRAGGVQLL